MNYPTELENFRFLTDKCCSKLSEFMNTSVGASGSPMVPYVEYYRKSFQRCRLQSKVVDVLVEDVQRSGKSVVVKQLKMEPLRFEMMKIVELEKLQMMNFAFPFDEEIQHKVVHCQLYSLDEEVLDARSFQLQPPQR
jgi:uncharacterized protein YlaN (UPF0358 family)